jgi:beta-glucanase (GH16 family)
MARRQMWAMWTALALFVSVVTVSPATPASAADTVIDGFEDGDASDWGFFGGNAAGGGGGALSDRPQEGNFYLSTGWGGDGSNSVFYGGFFKNFDDAAQVVPPADPTFGVWVLNQSDATVDQYTLEITIREDLDGNGWTDGAEDSFRLDTTFTSSSFDDQWTLLSAPLSSFTDLATGGDGTFDGNLDEVVVVVSGVQGGPGSTVEVDFDTFFFTDTPITPGLAVFDDMEHGDPSGNGWFTFGGSVGGGGIGPASLDLPPTDGGAFSLETGWGSGGVPGFFGGFGRTNPIDLTGTDHFNFWINPNGDQDYTLEINLQDDDDNNGTIESPADDEFQFNCVVSPTGPCAVAGGGWQQISIPLDDFFDDNSFLTGGNGVLDGGLINVVIAVIGNSGSDVNFRTDYWAFSDGPLAVAGTVVDDFESGVAPGTPCAPSSPALHFCTFSGAGSSITISNPATPPAPVLPAVGTPNSVLQLDVDVTSFAGVIHGFESGGLPAPQDWSTSEGFSFWFHGTGSDTAMFIDILDNRNPGSTTDDAERWRVDFVDDFSGWQFFEFPFSSFRRFEVGNGAPNDGFGRFEVHGWAFGTVGTGGPRTFYMDQVGLYGEAAPPALSVNFAVIDTPIEEGTTGNVVVKLNRPFNSDDPAQVSVDYATEIAGAIAGEEYTPTSGTLTFVSGGPTELTFPIETFDDTKFEGDERIVLRLSNPVDVKLGSTQARAVIVDNETFDPLLLDDFEKGAFLWDTAGPVAIEAERAEGADARPDQDEVENVLIASVPLSADISVQSRLCNQGDGVVQVRLNSTDGFDATAVDHTTVQLGNAYEAHVDTKTGEPRRHRAGDDLVFHFRYADTGLPCDPDVIPFTGLTYDGEPFAAGGSDAAFSRDFPLDQDWTGTESMSFWYYGSGGGEPVTVTLKNNRAEQPGVGSELVWSDEFDDPAGTVPNPDNWGYEIGDGALNGIEGWGNSELQYYTDDPANAATDGNGNLVITLNEADGSQECFYGTCEFTSARLISKDRAEFAYGRIESRLLVPDGGPGLWPAFWSLGTDIAYNPWPNAGEIDFMEYVSRIPNEIFGTIHGPGYSGGSAFGDVYDFGEPVSGQYHTFVTEWEPNLITWYVDGIKYHEATPAEVPGPWVYEKPFYLLLNFAIGGNFGGTVSPDNTYPQQYLIDYVRVFQGADTAERFEASFVDDFTGWQQVTIPMTDFVRSADQPAGAPDDGLNLDEVWGYGFALPHGNATSELKVDLVERNLIPPPTAVTVDTLADSGPGSLREAIGLIASDGTITFDPSLVGGTIGLSSGQLVIDRSVVIDGSDAPGLTISGSNASRVFQVAATADVEVSDLVISDGAAAPQGGGILNYGTLSLTRVVVTGNTETSAGPANFEFGGGGIYNGDGATLNLIDSTVSDNATLAQPGGGIYGFFNSTINITNSTVSGNVAGDVAGGLRALGDVNIVNSTISGNTSTAWHGGAAFLTDGTTTILNSTIAGNNAPSGTTGGLFVGTFGPSSATLNLQNSIVAANGDFGCFLAPFGAGAVAINSLGNNVLTDGTCNPVGSDQIVTDAGIGALADNGGPTLTHGLLAGSPAIDAGDAGACPATDQRGVARPLGAGCDIGAYEADGGS